MIPALPKSSPILPAWQIVSSWVLALLLLGATSACRRSAVPPSGGDGGGDAFAQFMNAGKNYYDKGEAQKALEPFQQAVALRPTAIEAQLNLANALLLSTNTPDLALRHALRAVELDRDSAAAHYVAGCAYMRLRQFEPALQQFRISKDIDAKVGATTFQLGRAHYELSHWEDAVAMFRELVSFEPEHPSAHFMLGQALVRLGRQDEANAELEKHRQIVAQRPGTMDAAKLERCVHTEARAPFLIEPPDRQGVSVRFAEVTTEVLEQPAAYGGPLGVIDYHRDGRNSLFVQETAGFRLLANSNGVFRPLGEPIPAIPGARYHRCLVADLQNDRYDDIIAISDQGSQVFRFATNAQITDLSTFSRLRDVAATDGVLVDLDFTGKLDLLAVNASNRTVRVMRNLGNLYFKDITATSGVPAHLTGATQLAVEDWNHDDALDVIVARQAAPPELLVKQRGGPLTTTNSPANWPAGTAIACGDFNNDLNGDLWIVAPDRLECILNGVPETRSIPFPGDPVRQLLPLDYDNDGWLDLVVAGTGLRVFRNLGADGFQETTAALGFDQLGNGPVDSIVAADFDLDGDTDLALTVSGQGLKILRNEGGNANLQVKVRLFGNKSNSSGIGTRVEILSGGLRIGRRVSTLPVEIGVGRHAQLQSLNARWLNLSLNNVDVQVDPRTTLPLIELMIPEGSCPYLYVWDGGRFRFVTDLLGAAPLGLRISDTRFVEADPDELVWLGDATQLRPREGHYLLQITEELREVLYLDAAQLVAVDHPVGTEVYTTGKMVPGRPFPAHDIVTLHRPHPLLQAVRSDGLEVTAALEQVDQQMASPVTLRIPHLRGLAEPWSLTLDFGPLAIERPLVLAITAWLQFGGGLVNVAASHNPDLPFPFPTLEAETEPDHWEPVDVVFGVPCGKTKNFVVDLTGRLPSGSCRLRIQMAYEIHWDRIALLERAIESNTTVTRLNPDVADLHWRGFSEHENWPAHLPLTPDYDRVTPNPKWRITPMGWCTRYGDVLELIERRDNALALLNGGDELTLRFAASRLPEVPASHQRGFFLYSCGWDKDSDFHCEKGWLVEPLPWHGLDDQLYGRQTRPVIDGDWWIPKYNTRWVGLWTVRRKG